MSFNTIFRLLAKILMVIAAIMFVPLVIALYFHETNALLAFVKTIAITFAVSMLILFSTAGKSKLMDMGHRDSYLFTVLTWIASSVFASLPFIFSGTMSSFSDAFFEVMSGLTTTGATRIVHVETCFKSILFWRSMTNWLGGMGIVVLFIALLPAIGNGSGGAFNMMGAETVGPVKGKLTASTKSTAMVLWLIYIGMTALQTILLVIGDIPLFDAITIAFSTVSTAGFTVKDASIGAYDNAYLDAIVTFFMLAASINFSLYYKLFTSKRREILKDSEMRWFLSIWFSASVLGALWLYLKHFYPTITQCFRHMSFCIASIMSTTGFETVDHMVWPSFCILLIFLTMFIGGCSGSTGGGIKVARILTMFKTANIYIRKRIHPNGVYNIQISGQIIHTETVLQIFSFCALYIGTWVIGAVIISLGGIPLQDCLSSSLLTIGNIGTGFGIMHFCDYPVWCDWIFSFLMLSGRLELMTVYVLFSKSFWKR